MRLGVVAKARRVGSLGAIAVAIAVVFATGQLRAEQSVDELDRKVYEIYQQVFSPFCPGRSLNDCPSSKAHELKLEIRRQLEQGVAPEAVLEEVFQRFGDQYRAVPQYAGFGKLVWWVPLAFLALGAVVALIIARGKRSDPGLGHSTDDDHGQERRGGASSGQSSPPADPVSEDLRKQIEAELARLD
jgi:cytochrome c-type biogenesis protein CcmH/NrfF